MNALRDDQEDETLTTADLVNSSRNRAESITPRQAYNAGLEPTHADTNRTTELRDNPPDYTPPPSGLDNAANAPIPPPPGPRPVASQIPPAAPVAPVPGPAASSSNLGPVPVPAGTTGPGAPGPLFPEDELHNFRARWDQVQTSFVDEPRKAVESADSLVANVVKRIAEQFANERENLEKQWDRGDNVNTEDLRQALKRYRAFFDRLLSF